jgi:hypothetical protein
MTIRPFLDCSMVSITIWAISIFYVQIKRSGDELAQIYTVHINVLKVYLVFGPAIADTLWQIKKKICMLQEG